jgi:hypothetical protein
MAKRGSKRKPELDLESERSSYASFVAAANAVSQLYTAGVREQRRTAKATLVSGLDRVPWASTGWRCCSGGACRSAGEFARSGCVVCSGASLL